jgi:large subunit ribosomal protein L15
VVNVGDLNKFDDNSEVNAQALFENKLIPHADKPVKILGNGELSKKLTIVANKVSASAKEKIEKAKGSVKELSVKKPEAKAE